MLEAQRSIDVAATPQQVWAVLGRFMHIDEFHPRVTKVDPLSPVATGVGAMRRCHFKDGTSAVEKVVDWQEGRSYQIELSEFSMPLTRALATFSVEPLEGGRSRASMLLEYQVKFGPFGWLLGKTMMALMMGKMELMVLGGLEARVLETSGGAVPGAVGAAA